MDTIKDETAEQGNLTSWQVPANTTEKSRRGRPKKETNATGVATKKTKKTDKIGATEKKDTPVKIRSSKSVAQKDTETQTRQAVQTSKIAQAKKRLQEGNDKHCLALDATHKEKCAHRTDAHACHAHHTLHPYHAHHHGTEDNGTVSGACHEHHTHHDCHPHHEAQHTLPPHHPCFERAQKIKMKRKIAKIGMTASLGLLTLTGFSHVLPYTKKTHAIAGLAMLGFSLWHANLYKNPHKKNVTKKKKNQEEQTKSAPIDNKIQTA